MTPTKKAYLEALERAKDLGQKSGADKGNEALAAEFAKAVEQTERLKADVRQEDALRASVMDDLGLSRDAKGGTIIDQIKATGFDAKSGHAGYVNPLDFYGIKADVVATEATAAPQRVEGVAGLGIDSRFLFPSIPTVAVPNVGVPTRIDYLREDTRTYPTAGTTELVLGHTTDKPATDVTVVEAQAAMKVFGTVSNSQPNALLDHDALKQVINRELVAALRLDIELHVITAILADANKNTLSQGTDIATDAIFKAIGDLADDGFTANVIAMNPANAESIWLQRDANDHYLREPGSPLFGVKVVASNKVTAGTVIVADTSGMKLYLSGVKLDANPFTNFAANRTVLRAEHYGVLTISQGTSIVDLTLA